MSIASSSAFSRTLRSLLSLAGITVGEHLMFSKWSPAGDKIGPIDIDSFVRLKELLTEGTFLLDMDGVMISGIGPVSFSVSYLNIDLDYNNGKWTGNLYTETEEVPHDFADPRLLDERRLRIQEKLLEVVRILSEISTSE